MSNRRRGRPNKYHWDEWLTLSHMVFTQGTHYDDADSFTCQMRDAACERGIRTRIVKDGDTVILWTRSAEPKAQPAKHPVVPFTTESIETV